MPHKMQHTYGLVHHQECTSGNPCFCRMHCENSTTLFFLWISSESVKNAVIHHLHSQLTTVGAKSTKTSDQSTLYL